MPMPAAHDTSPMPASDLTVLRSNPFCTLSTMFAGSESGEASPGSTDEADRCYQACCEAAGAKRRLQANQSSGKKRLGYVGGSGDNDRGRADGEGESDCEESCARPFAAGARSKRPGGGLPDCQEACHDVCEDQNES